MNRNLHIARIFFVQNLEAFIWISVLLYFACSTQPAQNHFTICPLALAGFEHCPGCGLGRSLILLIHGNISESFRMHPLAIFALPVLGFRIFTVFRNSYLFRKKMTNQSQINIETTKIII